MSVNALKGHSPRLKPANVGLTAKNPQKNTTNTPLNKTNQKNILPTKLNITNSKSQSSLSTSLISNNVVANRNTDVVLSASHNISSTNEPISNIDYNHTLFNYPPVIHTASNSSYNLNNSQHNKSNTTFATITANNKTPSRDHSLQLH
jgi:hypothetical protein